MDAHKVSEGRTFMSKLLFIGTGAADWSLSDKINGEYRRNSTVLLNDDLMLDCSGHIYDYRDSAEKLDIYDNVTDLLISHAHEDHFSHSAVSRLSEKGKIRVGSDGAIAEKLGDVENVESVILKPFEKTSIGRYTVTPILANHDIVMRDNACAFHFIIETPDKKTVFYGLDGAWFLRPSWEEMKKHVFDVMILDCTVGDFHDWRIFEHNTIPMLREMVREIKERGMIAESGKLIASHFARTLHESKEKTESILAQFGVLAAYDGFEIDI